LHSDGRIAISDSQWSSKLSCKLLWLSCSILPSLQLKNKFVAFFSSQMSEAFSPAQQVLVIIQAQYEGLIRDSVHSGDV